MPTIKTEPGKLWQLRDRRQQLLSWLMMLGLAIVFVAAFKPIAAATEWAYLGTAAQKAGDLGDRMWPPDISQFSKLLRPLWDTINIATLGTVLAIALAFPLCWFAAKNTSPHPAVRVVALAIIATSRSISSFIWALLFVMIIGPGILAGILAIAVRSVGFIAKLSYEAIEEIDPEPVEAITATGASRAQVNAFAILPQVRPAFFGIAIFRWDINIRESTVIGYVGGGGLGLLLNSAINALQWREASFILLLIFGLVIVSEAGSAKLRQALAER
ncbi:MAG: phosphonate transport system permease protein [Verrucomicrobiales bacterium]|jgi:phosphonate transport system permease protein